jgi:hypothetical protein
MGWGNGIAIGWANTRGSSGVTSVTVYNCASEPRVTYLNGSQFLPGTYAYADPELTVPFPWGGSGIYFNLLPLIDSIGGYEVSNSTGEIKNPLLPCPV